MTVRVVVVDDHDVIRVGVRESLDADIEVVGEARDVEGAAAAMTRHLTRANSLYRQFERAAGNG